MPPAERVHGPASSAYTRLYPVRVFVRPAPLHSGFAMKIRRLPLAAALALAASAFSAQAQVAASAPILAASAAPAAKTGPRLLTPTQSRDSGTTAGDVRPERRVTPQVNIPLGRKPTPLNQPKRPPGSAQAGGAAAGGINDGAARCEAQVDDQERADCHAKLAREGGKR
jgi:hypothetical protein